MAKDLQTIPLSTMALESAFSTGKRILSYRRCKLLEKLMEAPVCLKNLYDVADRIQNLKLNDESEE